MSFKWLDRSSIFAVVLLMAFAVAYSFIAYATTEDVPVNLYRVTILTGDERGEVFEQSELDAESFREVMVHLYIEDHGLRETALIKVEQATFDRRFYGQTVTSWDMVYPYLER